MPGFQLARNQTNPEYPGTLETFIYPVGFTAALAIGDIVGIGSGASANGIMDVARPTVKASSNAGDLSNTLVGVVMGNDIDPDNEVVGIPANAATDRFVRVSTSQTAIYEVEVSGTSIIASMVGLNATVIANLSTVASLSTSGFVIDGTTNIPKTSDAENWPFRLLGITEFDSNAKATKVLVRPNFTVIQELAGA